MIEFIVEDGTAKSTATSYVTVSEYRQYWENRGEDFSSTPELNIKSKLNIATEFVELNFIFKEIRYTDTQSLEWPRSGVSNGVKIFGIDEIPQELKNAVCYLANQDDLNIAQEGLSKVNIGPVKKEFSNKGSKEFTVANNLLKNITVPGNKMARVN